MGGKSHHMAKKTCFVIQGFGKKQDYQTGRTLDLDASYEVIKEAVIDAGLECIRADEIKHSGTIDQPMFEQILGADLVIADLSTYNVNAAYELGVRHALRPLSTIIVAETGFKYPFDFSHIAIRTYEHMGAGHRTAARRSGSATNCGKPSMLSSPPKRPTVRSTPSFPISRIPCAERQGRRLRL